jgi:DNA-binding CsgD family transcriptional regulator
MASSPCLPSALLAQALDAVGVGLLLCGEDGHPHFENAVARRLLDEPAVRGAAVALAWAAASGCVAEPDGAPLRGDLRAPSSPIGLSAFGVPAGAVVVVRETPSPPAPSRPTRAHGLTRTEETVARLLALRRTNREIAAELGVSYHTAKHHVERVLHKLGVASRNDVAATFDGQPERR